MHFTFFSVKRLFLCAMHKVQIPMLRRVGLTPARFDVLYILWESRGEMNLGSFQHELWKALGVSRATMCKMTKLLAALGLVKRERVSHKRVNVTLTKLGYYVMRHALKFLRIRKRGPVDRTVNSIFVREWWSASAWLAELDGVQFYFGRLRGVLSDTATHYYDWHPDD
jgi:DNA-binding MarR family transcriptional regulator